jgi:alkylation response protein AidB-like acyl-CoA dehydrogenase
MELNEDQLALRDLVRDFAQNEIKPVRQEWDEKNEHPKDLVDKAVKELQLNALNIPEEFGGMGYGAAEAIVMAEELSRIDAGICLAITFTNLGVLPLLVGGSKEQKKKWLPDVAAGNTLVAFALTEPGAGSDVPAISTSARLDGDKYILNGTKQWITGAGVADAYTVFAVTNPEKGTRGVSCLWIEKDSPGLSFGKKENKMGIRASVTRSIIFEDCEVPKENLIGRKGNGFIYALKTLNASRPLVGALGMGIQRGCIDEAAKYAREREQFGVKISTFQAIQHMLADMQIRYETSKMITYAAAWAVANKAWDAPKLSAIAKCYSSDCAVISATDAVQILGGYGYVKEYPVEKFMRDSKILQIFEGTNQIQRNEIAAYVIKEAAATK